MKDEIPAVSGYVTALIVYSERAERLILIKRGLAKCSVKKFVVTD